MDEFDIISRTLQAQAIPGEVVYITNEEGHCLWWALATHCEREELTPYFYIERDEIEQTTDTWIAWNKVFELEDQKYRLKGHYKDHQESATAVSPAEEELSFLETLVTLELERLEAAGQDARMVCGHEASWHCAFLKQFFEREIVPAKRFAATRQVRKWLSPEEKTAIVQEKAKPVFARSDIAREIEEALEQERIRLRLDDLASIRELETLEMHPERLPLPNGLTLEDIPKIKEAIRVNRDHRATIDDARKQLWALCEGKFDIR